MTARITWLGHATVLLELGGVRLLTDPVLRSRLGHLRRHGPPPAPPGRTSTRCSISHLHLDHLDLPSLRRLAPHPSSVVPARRRGLPARRGLRGAWRSWRGGESADVGGRARSRPCRPSTTGPPAAGRAGAPTRSDSWSGGERARLLRRRHRSLPGMAALGAGRPRAAAGWGWGPTLGAGPHGPRARRPRRRAAAAARRGADPLGHVLPPAHARPRGAGSPTRRASSPLTVAELAPDVEVRVLEPGESSLEP